MVSRTVPEGVPHEALPPASGFLRMKERLKHRNGAAVSEVNHSHLAPS